MILESYKLRLELLLLLLLHRWSLASNSSSGFPSLQRDSPHTHLLGSQTGHVFWLSMHSLSAPAHLPNTLCHKGQHLAKPPSFTVSIMSLFSGQCTGGHCRKKGSMRNLVEPCTCPVPITSAWPVDHVPMAFSPAVETSTLGVPDSLCMWLPLSHRSLRPPILLVAGHLCSGPDKPANIPAV